LDMDSTLGTLLRQDGAKLPFFLATPDDAQSRVDSLPSHIARSHREEIHAFQAGQPTDVAHDAVLVCPSQSRADRSRSRTKELSIESEWQLNDMITKKCTDTREGIIVCTHSVHLA